MKAVRHLRLVGATGEIRTAVFEEREHLVVPVVGVVEGVVWAVNSDVPELVTAEELALSPQQWNGRRCFAGHPKDDNTQVSANTPRMLEQSFGVLFATASPDRILETKRLSFEAWLDPVKAAQVGPDAMNVLRRLQAGERVEVSVGCYVEARAVDGEYNGVSYHGEWTGIVSDHLAFLAEGQQGACSVAAGCGAPRAALVHLVTAEGIRLEEPTVPASTPTPQTPGPKPSQPTGPQPSQPTGPQPSQKTAGEKRSLAERLKALFNSLRGSEGMSDSDLRYRIDAALRAVEPGYMWIENVYPDDGVVIYCVSPTDEYETMRRSFTTAADGSVALTDDAEEVEQVTSYEPVVKAAAAKTASTTPCSCGGQQARAAEGQPTTSQGVTAMNKKEVAAKLAASKHCTIKDVTILEGANEDVLKALEEHVDAATLAEEEAAKAAAAPVVQPAPTTAASKPLTKDEVFAVFPELKTMSDQHVARETAEKNALVVSLKAASSHLTEEQLKAKSLDDLRTLAAFAKVETPAADYSGLGAPRVLAGKEDYTPPNSYELALKAKSGAATH